jgi:gamma-glutamylcyclotransferase (GGCT)/AIG2-like uncharacterized protein YtfP
MILFVYGTLKQGDCRASAITGRFIGTAKTSEDFTLYSCGAFPAMVLAEESTKTGVIGELYEVDESLLDNRLDDIEGVPFLYDRGTVQIESIEFSESADPEADAAITEATTYIYQRPTSRLEHLGEMWEVSRGSRWS